MSAFFFALNRDQSEFDPKIARDMMRQLNVFGHDQACLQVQTNFALGYQSLWTVPEEVGEVQPLYKQQQGCWFLFDGRIDNRSFLLDALNVTSASRMSDAQLMLLFYSTFGTQRLNEVIGPFVFVAFNEVSGKLFAARDGMGGRNLVFHVCEKFIFLATYEMALVAHPSIEYKINHSRVARIIARLVEDNLSSPIAGLKPLEPGAFIEIKDVVHGGTKKDYFYRFDSSKRIALESNQAYASRFKYLLDQAVKRRSRAIGSIGSMLSGGFDSVPMSILLAQQLAKQEKQLTAFSWVFDRHKEVDEREYSQEVCEKYNIDQVCINCDDVWPKFDQTMYINPVMPFSIPYVALQQAVFKEAQAHDVRTILSGVHGDLLYGYTDSILWELIKQGRWNDFIRESKHRLQTSNSVWQWCKRYILSPLPWVQRYLEKKRLKTTVASDLLTDNVLLELKNAPIKNQKYKKKALRPIAYNLVMGGFAGEDIAYGRHIDAQHGIDRRYPYRDRELCEFMLSIPSDQLQFNGITRPIVRRAFDKEFTNRLLNRKTKTSFYPAIKSGIANDNEYEKWFSKADAAWQFYIKKSYFEAKPNDEVGIDVIRWQCGYYNYWVSVCYDNKQFNKGDE